MTDMADHYLTSLRDLEAYWADQADIDNNGNPNEAMKHLTEIRGLRIENARLQAVVKVLKYNAHDRMIKGPLWFWDAA